MYNKIISIKSDIYKSAKEKLFLNLNSKQTVTKEDALIIDDVITRSGYKEAAYLLSAVKSEFSAKKAARLLQRVWQYTLTDNTKEKLNTSKGKVDEASFNLLKDIVIDMEKAAYLLIAISQYVSIKEAAELLLAVKRNGHGNKSAELLDSIYDIAGKKELEKLISALNKLANQYEAKVIIRQMRTRNYDKAVAV